MKFNKIYCGDALEVLKSFDEESVDCIVTSPPYYGLRDYGVKGQIGLEKTLDEYFEKMLAITAELKRVLKPTGTMWWDHGDSYGTGSGAGDRSQSKHWRKRQWESPLWYTDKGKKGIAGYEKCLLLQAHRLAIRMIDEQRWILRNTIIWHKSNCMPSSVKDRFTVDYEPIFFFTKSKKYWFEQQYEKPLGEWGARDRSKMRGGTDNPKLKHHGLTEGNPNPLGRNKRSVWKISAHPYPEAHFATFPQKLIETPIKAGCPEGGIVLDPFMGSGTTALVARQLGRKYVGIELNKFYIAMANKRLAQKTLL